MLSPQAVVFDMDGTLVDTERVSQVIVAKGRGGYGHRSAR